MEDDIRDLVQGTSPPRPDAKSLKSRSKSTTAKSSKKKKKSTDSKSKSKSTTTAKKKRDKSAGKVPDPATLTIQVPPVAASLPMVSEIEKSLPVPLSSPKTSVSENLQEIINEPAVPVATSPTVNGADSKKDVHDKDKASKPRKKKDSKKAGTSSKRKEQQKQKQEQQQQQQQQQEEEEEGEEKKKRRERLMVSPFEFLHITPFRHGDDEFHDDISFLTLPKPLRDQEAKSNGETIRTEEEDLHLENHLAKIEEKNATPQAPTTNNSETHESKDAPNQKPPAIDPSNNTPADQPQPMPAPGWARKAKPDRATATTEQASTDLSHSPEMSSLPSAHPHHPSPVIPVVTIHANSNDTPQLKRSDEASVNPPKNHLPKIDPSIEKTTAAQEVSPETIPIDRTRSWRNNVDQTSRDPGLPQPLEQETHSLTIQDRPLEKEKKGWPMFTPWRRQVTLHTQTSSVQFNSDIESGNTQQQANHEENKITLVHDQVKHSIWLIATAAICFVCLVMLTIILVIILAKD